MSIVLSLVSSFVITTANANSKNPQFGFAHSVIGLNLVTSQLSKNQISNYKNPQQAFAHRVHQINSLSKVLESGANGIEIDVCWQSTKDLWYVSHNDGGVCELYIKKYTNLEDYLDKLVEHLESNKSIRRQFSMLWLDIKDPNGLTRMNKLVKLIHQKLPSHLQVLYDFTDYNNNSRARFEAIYKDLLPNEGASFHVLKKEDVRRVYDYFKKKGFKRGTINHGDSLIIKSSFLCEANDARFNVPNDPYRFKQVYTWTTKLKKEMVKYMDTSACVYSNGQIFGEWNREWKEGDDVIWTTFEDAIKASETERLATSADNDPFGFKMQNALEMISIL